MSQVGSCSYIPILNISSLTFSVRQFARLPTKNPCLSMAQTPEAGVWGICSKNALDVDILYLIYIVITFIIRQSGTYTHMGWVTNQGTHHTTTEMFTLEQKDLITWPQRYASNEEIWWRREITTAGTMREVHLKIPENNCLYPGNKKPPSLLEVIFVFLVLLPTSVPLHKFSSKFAVDL